jgi:hypothetical protein
MQLNDFQNFAIRGNLVTKFVLDGSTVNGVNGTSSTQTDGVASGVSAGEGAIRLTNLVDNPNQGDAALISDSTVTGGFTNTVTAENTVSNIGTLTIDGSEIDGLATMTGDGLHVGSDSTGSQVHLDVTDNSVLTAGHNNVINVVGALDSTLDIDIDTSTITNTLSGTASSGGTGINVQSLGDVTYDIEKNTIDLHAANGGTGVGGYGISLGELPGGDGDFNLNGGQGIISGNTIGVSGVAHSGGGAAGISVFNEGLGTTVTTSITNNQIHAYGTTGILVQAINGSGTMNATVTGNTTQADATATNANGLSVTANRPSSTDAETVNLLTGGTGSLANDFSAGNTGTGSDIILVNNGTAKQFALSYTVSDFTLTPSVNTILTTYNKVTSKTEISTGTGTGSISKATSNPAT